MTKHYVHLGWRPPFTLTEIPVPFPPLAGTSLLFAADLHIREGDDPARVRAIAQALSSKGDEAVLLGGDIAESSPALSLFLDMLSRETPVYCVAGNNDALPDFEDQLASHGIHLLRCETVPLLGGRLLLTGSDDLRLFPEHAPLIPEKKEGVFRLFLTHFPLLPERCPLPDMMLAGHTHGGQIRLLGITPYNSRLEKAYITLRGEKMTQPCVIAGRQRVRGVDVFVTRGVGMSRLPIRVGCPGEIHRIVFTEK